MKADPNMSIVELALANYNYAVKTQDEDSIARRNHILLTGVNSYNSMSKSKLIAFDGIQIIEIGSVNEQ